VPLVSIVLIFLNEERFLEEAVNTVRTQTMEDWELILVDDGSTDKSAIIGRRMAAEDNRIRCLDHPRHANRGMSASRNLGVAHANSPYIAFIDADDVWERSKLAEQVEVLESMPDVAMVVGAVRYWHSWNPAATEKDFTLLTGGVADRRIDPPEAALMLYPLGKETGAGVDLLVRRSVFDEVGGFEEQFRTWYEDQAFNIKVLLRYPIYISSRVWRHYRQHDASCWQHMTPKNYWHVRSVFLDWLHAYIGTAADPRVAATLRRARREVRFQRLKAYVVDRLLSPLPLKYQDLVKLNLRRFGREITKNPQPVRH